MQKLYVCKLNILKWQNKKMMADFAFLQQVKIFPNYIFFPAAKELLIFHFCVRQSYAFLE